MKKRFIIFFVLISCLLTACTLKEENKETNLSSLAENGMDIIKPPKGCEIVYNNDNFQPVTQNQEYQFELDHNTKFELMYGIADSGDIIYCYFSNNLFYYNKAEDTYGLLCSKPDCEHNSEKCDATLFGGMGLQYYDGNLYTLLVEDMRLVKLKIDGTERERICSLFGVDEDSVKIQADAPGRTCNWIIHRGYIYYIYQYDAGNTADVFYLNGSNCLWRMALDGSGKPECIMPFVSESNAVLSWIKAYGSYIYFNVPDKESYWGNLYRYNIESNEVEALKDLGNTMYGYSIEENEIFYNIQENYDIHRYNLETGEKNIFYEGNEPYMRVQSDEDYIYIMYVPENLPEDERARVDVFDWEGNKVETLPIWSKKNPDGSSYTDSFCGTDDSKIYFNRSVIMPTDSSVEDNPWGLNSNGYYELYYIEKEDLADGEFEIHEVK